MDELTRLWLGARDGDHVAFAQAVRASQADVWRLARHLVGPSEADDATQETFVRAWRAIPAYRGDSSARTWLLAIARRTCADSIRSSVRRRRLASRVRHDRSRSAPDAGDPGGEHALHELVDDLDLEQREAFTLTQIVGCSYAEVAEICEIPIGTVRSRVARARERLVERIAEADTG